MSLICALTLGALAPLSAQQDTSTIDTIFRMSEVVVSATRSGETRRLNEAAALSLIVPSITDISRGTVVVDLLRDVPGVHVQQTSAGQGAVILRGLVGNQVLLLVNGIPLNNGTYRDGPGQYLATIDPTTIERIEVIRGPASVLYGSDAQGGVVNVITRTHAFQGTRSVRFTGNASSANSGYRGRFSAGVLGSSWSLAVGGTLATTGDLRAGGGLGHQRPTGFDAAGLDAELTFEVGDRHSFRGAVQHFEMSDVPRYDRYVNFRAPTPGRDAEHTFDPQTRQLTYARYVFTPQSPVVVRIETTASLSIQREGRNRIKLLPSGAPDQFRTQWRDDVYTPGVSLVGASMFHVADHVVSLTWGGDFYHDRLNSRGDRVDLTSGQREPIVRETTSGDISSGRFPDGANADRLGTFLSGEVVLAQWLRFSAGARWSRFRNAADVGTDFGGRVENTSSDLTGQLGIVLAPAAAWRIVMRLAEGFRAPNLYDLTNVGPVPTGIVVPNPSAVPEHSLSAELGVRYSAARGAFAVTVYRTTITDFIDRTPGTFQGDTLFDGERVFQGQNVGTARVVGVEAEAVARLGPLEARGMLLYSRGEQEDAAGVETAMSKMPPLGGSGTLRWASYGRRVWIEYTLRWAARQDRLGIRDLQDTRIPLGGTPGFGVQGINAGAVIAPRLSITAGIENLTDKLYRTHASGVDNAGRHVWVGLSALGVL